MYKFHACYSPRHVPNSSLILRAWLLINLGEKRKVRVGCEAQGPGELMAASMSHASDPKTTTKITHTTTKIPHIPTKDPMCHIPCVTTKRSRMLQLK